MWDHLLPKNPILPEGYFTGNFLRDLMIYFLDTPRGLG